MIPIKLRIQGLYSYQDVQEVDFRPLAGASVFGIFGKVGSGKTSLLEAISFALYGETERLNGRDNRQYNMMNLKSKQLMIDFEFQAGPDQAIYKFTYEARRHPKKHHEIGAGERRMFIRKDDDWTPIGTEKDDVAVLTRDILGIDYDNFKRIIIIPQNQFREFLELGAAERTKMMNQLFKLDQYDLAGRVAKLNKANDEQLSELRGLLSPLEAVTPEAIDEARSVIAAVTEALTRKDTDINELLPTEQRLLDRQKQRKTLSSLQQELSLLLGQEASYREREQTLALYESCLLLFQADLAGLEKANARKSRLTESERIAQQQLLSVTKRLAGLEQLYEAARQAYESRDELQQKIDELDTVQQIRTLQQTIGEQTHYQTTLSGQLDRQAAELERHKAARAQQQQVLDQGLGRTSDLERLYQVKNWFAVYAPLKKQADDLQAGVERYDQAINDLKQEKNEVLAGFPAEWADLTLKVLPDYIDNALTNLKTIRQEREQKHRQLLIQDELRKYADALSEGQPCPLCGSAHHPDRHRGDADPADVQRSEAALEKVIQRIEDTSTLQLTIKELVTKLRAELENGKRLIQERADIVKQLTEHEDRFVWPEFSKEREGEVTEAIRRESDAQQQLQDAQQAIRNLDQLITDAEKSYNDLSKKVIETGHAIAGLSGQLKTAAESLAHFRLDEVTNWRLDQIDALRASLSEVYNQARLNFDATSKQKSEAEKELATVEEQIQQLHNQLSELATELDALDATIARNLEAQRLTLDQVSRIVRSELNVGQEKQQINEYNEQRSGLQRQVDLLEAELTQHPFDPDELTTVQQQLAILQAEKDELNKEHGRATSVLAALETQWQQKLSHQKRHDELELRRQDLKKMDEMFRAQGFVNYVSSVYLKSLCESANERFFKLTNNQLKLELDEKNNFQIRDYMNGGELRSVKTLSGGQTFQAALSMALALSDNIQHLTKARQNLFFLDEGFGTLDKDALQTVFKTLKALRTENRVVGIISHVDDLQHEVDTYIRTIATETGSRIETSWD